MRVIYSRSQKCLMKLLPLLAMIYTICIGCASHSSEHDPEKMLAKAIELHQRGLVGEAIEQFESIVAETEHTIGSSPALALAYLYLARIQSNALHFVQADSNFFYSEQVIERYKMSDTLLATAFWEHGKVRLGLDDFEGSADLYRRAIDLYKQHFDSCDCRVRWVQDLLSEVYTIRGDFRTATSYIEQWLACKSLPDILLDSLALARVSELTSNYLVIGENDRAKRTAKFYLDHYISVGSQYPNEIAGLYLSLADAALLRGDLKGAIAEYESGFMLIKDRSDTLSSVFRRYMRALAEYYFRSGDTLTAIAYYERFKDLTGLKYGQHSSIYRESCDRLHQLRQD